MPTLKAVLHVAAILLVLSGSQAPAQTPTITIGGKTGPDVYLQSLDIQVEVTGNVASTRYTMVFKNKTDRVLEGVLTFPLPDGSSATYCALDVNGAMREAVPVEKTSGTQVFEEIEQRWNVVDPSLLETVGGSSLRVRVYPIFPNGRRTISVGYEEVLALERGALYYRLPFACPDSLEKFAVNATVLKSGTKPVVTESDGKVSFNKAGENYVVSFIRENYRPSRALVFALPAPVGIPRVAMRPADGFSYFLASATPKMKTRKKKWSNDLAVIWDVSLSGSTRDLKREMEMLNIIFAEKKNANVHLYFLNNRNILKGAYKVVNGKWDELKNSLETAVFDGGTDFSAIDLNDIDGNEILFFSDGLSTLSGADFLNDVRASRPIHCVVSSAKADYGAMKRIAGKTKGKFVNVNVLSPEKLKNELLNETPMFLGVEHGNAVREVYPSVAAPVYGNFSVAGISDSARTELTLLFGFGGKVEKRIRVKLDANKAAVRENTDKIWAQKKNAELDLEYEKNRGGLTELGLRHCIVTRNASLIVLEDAADYVLYGIEPPASEPELLAEYHRRWDGFARSAVSDIRNVGSGRTRFSGDFMSAGALIGNRDTANIRRDVMLNIASVRYAYKKRAKEKSGQEGILTLKFSVDEFGKVIFAKATGVTVNDSVFENSVAAIVKNWKFDRSEKPRDITDVTCRLLLSSDGVTVQSCEAGPRGIPRSRDGVTLDGAASAAEKLKEWRESIDAYFAAFLQNAKSEYSAREQIGSAYDDGLAGTGFVKADEHSDELTGRLTDDYQIYLYLRNRYAYSPAYYYTMADWFYKRGDSETALRVLTSIADLEFENASLYRMLGYKFKEYGEYALEKYVFGKVVEWRPTEPQSYRDYALALADNGETQAALDSLCSLLTRPYPENIINRNLGMEEIIVTEINGLIAKNPGLNTSKIDKRLLIDNPVDIRVVVNLNSGNAADIGLHVSDPNGVEPYYAQTVAGWRISSDIANGYGPQQFLLKNAVKGNYRVYVYRYRDTRLTSAGPPVIMAEVYTRYADKNEKRRIVTLQIPNAKETGDGKTVVNVAEFEF